MNTDDRDAQSATDPQSSALTKLRHSPLHPFSWLEVLSLPWPRKTTRGPIAPSRADPEYRRDRDHRREGSRGHQPPLDHRRPRCRYTASLSIVVAHTDATAGSLLRGRDSDAAILVPFERPVHGATRGSAEESGMTAAAPATLSRTLCRFRKFHLSHRPIPCQ